MPAIQNVFPAADSTGVPVGVTVFVVFDEEIDPTTVDRAFLISGPDTDRWTGPDLQLFDRPSTPDPELFLDSPAYTGIVQGTFEIKKLNTSNVEVDNATYSYGGPASYKSKVIFTPNDVLSAITEYTVIVSGDELDTDDIKVGIQSRTVFDTILGTNLGDGEVTYSGGYTGTITDQYVVQITVAGDIGTAKYIWYKTSDSLTVHTGTTSTHEVLLEDGVFIVCDGENFIVGDEFRVNVRPPTYMTGSMTWSFTTGSGSIVAVPSTTSTSVIGDIGSTSVDTTPFLVLSTVPDQLTSQVSIETDTIIINFNDAVDPDTITQESVKVSVHPARGKFTGNTVVDLGDIPKILTLSSDQKKLTIKI